MCVYIHTPNHCRSSIAKPAHQQYYTSTFALFFASLILLEADNEVYCCKLKGSLLSGVWWDELASLNTFENATALTWVSLNKDVYLCWPVVATVVGAERFASEHVQYALNGG